MAVEAGHRREAAQIAQCLGGIVGTPAPIRIHREQRNMTEHDDRRITGQRCDVFSDEVQLLDTQMPELFKLSVFTSAITCTPAISKLYQPSPRVPAPNTLRYFWPASSTESCSPGTVNICAVRSPVSICLT